MTNRIRVLLIDDETVFVDGLVGVLTRRGMQVQSVNDGLKALDLLANELYDVLVLDLRMPGMDGVELLKAIRERDVQTPVIVLTGNVSIKQLAEVVKECVAEVLLKPCRIDTLVSCIENVHERKVCAIAMQVAEKC
ncbi:MAG: response regulator [Desulfuromonadaceae bacterium]